MLTNYFLMASDTCRYASRNGIPFPTSLYAFSVALSSSVIAALHMPLFTFNASITVHYRPVLLLFSSYSFQKYKSPPEYPEGFILNLY